MSDDFSFPDTGKYRSSGPMILKWFMLASILIGILGTIIFTSTMKVPSNPQVDECKSNIKYLGDALMMYTQDHGEVFPEKGIDKTFNRPIWLHNIFVVKPKEQAGDLAMTLKCYSDETDAPSSYIMNERLAGKSVKSIKKEYYPNTILLYERPTGRYHRWAYYMDGEVKPYKQPKNRKE